MKSLKTNIYFKIGTILFITLLLLIPTAMIESLINERQATQEQAISEVSGKWANSQNLVGPIVSVPFYKYMKEVTKKNKDTTTKIVKIKDYIHFLPSQLKIDGKILPEQRNRGIYEIVVYNSKINLSGNFDEIKFLNSDIPFKDIEFSKATLSLGIDDLRGIEKQIKLNWNASTSSFNPGVESTDIIKTGINAPVKIEPNDSLKYNFSFNLDLKGSQILYFTPVGKITDVSINSPWKTPSFNGAFLPDNRQITDKGFTANWNILHLNRNYPQSWIGSKYQVNESLFGIDLLLPVDNYQKAFRSIRYAILFIAFTFLTFFFIEILNRIFIHPIQYILIGIALIVFYTLLLSISEHLTFNLAFIISAFATLLLIAGYIKAILKSTQLTYLIIGILSILYTFIYVIIQLEDYALLIGSIGIFIILALVMYFSRKIDWYNLSLKETDKLTESN
ncbi:MAG: cell envelope integrity protein CreD [Flavobacterium sp.]|nr:cell envelope integrity protein CreD [Flavobacterium sp.]